MPHHIFLSYSRSNSETMRQIREDFRREKLQVWTDEGIEPGTLSWKRAIETGILESACLVCILSPDAAASTWVRAELDFAEVHQKPIFLILAQGDERSAIPFGYTTFQWTDIRNSSTYVANIRRLIEAIRQRLQERNDFSTTNTVLPEEFEPPEVKNILPVPFEWCKIPAGKTKLGNATFYNPPGTAGGVYEVESFYLARYPITNAQYMMFIVDTEGYRNTKWWDYSDSALKWRKNNPRPQPTAFPGDHLPRTNVSWFEAVAFCLWLKSRLVRDAPNKTQLAERMTINLPSEEQWQWAAMGESETSYPWSDTFDISQCNTLESGMGQPTPVTKYLHASSPFGVADMSGNVWEWCLSEWGNDSVSVVSNASHRVVRGGSWVFNQQGAKSRFRNTAPPSHRSHDQGFRIRLRLL